MKNLTLFIALLFCYFISFAQPANDECTGAIDLGTLPSPNACDGSGTEGQGATASFNGLTNVNATGANPYTYIAGCQGGATDMANPAQDVWYTITATGNSIDININNLSGFSNPSIGFWEGSCSGLTARGCANGTGSTIFEPTTPGQTYYIQISGDDATSEGTFDLDISNSNDCAQCVTASSLTADPLPVNGTYTAATEVSFCYTISEFEQVNTNWLHGVAIEGLGSGWDPTFGTGGIQVTSTPGSCQGNYGDWVYYSTAIGGGCNVTTPGWYYILPTSADPCDNFGDPGVAEAGGMGACALTFCFTLKTNPLGTCDETDDLNFSINTTADGETGSWTSIACGGDPEFDFTAIPACCTAPTAVVDNQILCFGDSNGVATVTAGSTANPFDYQWFGTGGAEVAFETTGTNSTTNTESTLFEDTYTIIVTDNNGCQAATELIMTTAPGATINGDNSDTICSNDDKTIATFTPAPGGSTFSWTSSTDVGFGTTGTTQIGTFTATNNTSSIISTNVTVVPISSLGCGGIPQLFTIDVNPSPIVSALPAVNDCSIGDINSSFTPVPTTTQEEFGSGLDILSDNGGSNGGMGIGVGTGTAAISGISPSPLEPGQVISACFSLRHECPIEINYISLEVNGTTYTSTSGSPGGATLNAALTTLLGNIQGATSGVVYSDCFPASVLSLFDGFPTNTDWNLQISDATATTTCTGKGIGDLISFEVIIENTPVYDFNWSPAGSLSGTTSGASTVATLPVVTASADGEFVLEVTDSEGCRGLDTAIFACALSVIDIDFNVISDDIKNTLSWSIDDISNIRTFSIQRKNNNLNWKLIETIKTEEDINFSYIDNTFNAGNNQYRLKITNNNGTIDHSQIRQVNNKSRVKNIVSIHNTLGQQVKLNTKGIRFIIYDDGSVEKSLKY